MKRRSFLTTSLASGAAIGLGLTAKARAMKDQAQEGVQPAAYKRISCEEGFSIPEVVNALRKASGGVPSAWSGPIAGPFMPALLDLGEGRIRAMDKAGVDMQVLALASPGVQMFDAPTAMSLARLANDRLAESVRKNPTRLTGLCTLAPQDPAGAAKEMERAVRTLGFKGAVVNSHTHGEYLDDPKYWPILEAAQALGVPLYIHPRDPSPGLAGPLTLPGFFFSWSYGVEAGTHALRLIAAGVFNRYPNLRIVLGHMGETLPFVLDRIDNRYEWEVKMFGNKKLGRLPSEYFKNHFVVTTSGMNYRVPMMAAIAKLGADRVLFAADYPMEEASEAVAAVEAMELSMQDRWKVFETNARKVFAL